MIPMELEWWALLGKFATDRKKSPNLSSARKTSTGSTGYAFTNVRAWLGVNRSENGQSNGP